jgi:hypothetical protein
VNELQGEKQKHFTYQLEVVWKRMQSKGSRCYKTSLWLFKTCANNVIKIMWFLTFYMHMYSCTTWLQKRRKIQIGTLVWCWWYSHQMWVHKKWVTQNNREIQNLDSRYKLHNDLIEHYWAFKSNNELQWNKVFFLTPTLALACIFTTLQHSF